MIEDYCEFFRNIEADPNKIVTGLTVRDFLKARMHLASCDECKGCAERTLEKGIDNSDKVWYNGN